MTDDQQGLRDLVEAYARGLDRREFDTVAALFTSDATLTLYGNETKGREQLATAFHVLDRYDVTTHFLGQTTVDIDGDRATGETYCLAHHLSDQGNRVMSIRYQDVFTRVDGRWYFLSRELVVDWEERRPPPEAKAKPEPKRGTE
jgi:uncharacterized protein (TIGR02246 family)